MVCARGAVPLITEDAELSEDAEIAVEAGEFNLRVLRALRVLREFAVAAAGTNLSWEVADPDGRCP